MLVTAGWRENLELLAPLRCDGVRNDGKRCNRFLGRLILPIGSVDSVMGDQAVSARLEIVCPDRRCNHRNVWPLTTVELCT